MSADLRISDTSMRYQPQPFIGRQRTSSLSCDSSPLASSPQPSSLPASAPVSARPAAPTRRASRNSYPLMRPSSSPPETIAITIEQVTAHLASFEANRATLDEVVDYLNRHQFIVRTLAQEHRGRLTAALPTKKIELLKRLIDESSKTAQNNAAFRENDLASAFYGDVGTHQFQTILTECAQDSAIFTDNLVKKLTSDRANEEKKIQAKDTLVLLFANAFFTKIAALDTSQIKILHHYIFDRFTGDDFSNKKGLAISIFLNRVVTPCFLKESIKAAGEKATQKMATVFKEFAKHLQRASKDLQEATLSGPTKEALDKLGTLLW